MLLVKPSSEILTITPNALQLIEVAGRTCYKSEEKMSESSAPAFAAKIIKQGHETVLEHASATVRFIVDRGVSHEIVRHRIASYSQESTRYCDYEGGHVAFVIPPWCDAAPGDYERVEIRDIPGAMWFNHMLNAEIAYKTLRDQGWRPEQARSVLPNSLKTEIVMTANFREWRHFFKLRTAPAAHPQMREVAIPLLAEMMRRVLVVFDDLV